MLWALIFKKMHRIPSFKDNEKVLEAGLPEALLKTRSGPHVDIGTPKYMYAHHLKASLGKGRGPDAVFLILPTSQVARNTIRNTMAFLKVINNISNYILLECY